MTIDVQQTNWRKLHILGIASGINFLGSSLTGFAVILRDKDVAGPIGVSLILLAMMVPTIVFAPLGGLLADKFSTRQLVPPLQVIMALSTLTLAFGWPHWWTYIALGVTAACGIATSSAYQAARPTITRNEDISRATGLQQTYISTGTLFAPALGGILVSLTGYVWPFIIDAASFIILSIVTLLIGINRPGVVHEAGEKLKAMDGLRSLMADRLVRAIIILVAVFILSLGAVGVGEVYLLIDELKASTFIYGLVGTAFAAGSVSGGLFTTWLKVPTHRQPFLMVVGIVVLLLGFSMLSIAWHWGVALVTYFVAGVGNAMLNAYGVGIIVQRTNPDVRGRTMAAVSAVFTTSSVASSGLAGILIAQYGVRGVLFYASIMSALALVIFAPSVLRAGKLDRTRAETEVAQPV